MTGLRPPAAPAPPLPGLSSRLGEHARTHARSRFTRTQSCVVPGRAQTPTAILHFVNSPVASRCCPAHPALSFQPLVPCHAAPQTQLLIGRLWTNGRRACVQGAAARGTGRGGRRLLLREQAATFGLFVCGEADSPPRLDDDSRQWFVCVQQPRPPVTEQLLLLPLPCLIRGKAAELQRSAD